MVIPNPHVLIQTKIVTQVFANPNFYQKIGKKFILSNISECPEIISVIVEEAQQFQLPFDFQFDFQFGELRGLYRYSGQHNGASMYEKNDKLGYIYREELATNRTKRNWQIGVQKFDNGTAGLFAVKSSCPTNARYWARLDTEESTWFQTGVKLQDATGEYKINMWNKIVEKTPLWKKQLYLGFGLGIGIGGLFLFPIIYFTCRFGHPGPSTRYLGVLQPFL